MTTRLYDPIVDRVRAALDHIDPDDHDALARAIDDRRMIRHLSPLRAGLLAPLRLPERSGASPLRLAARSASPLRALEVGADCGALSRPLAQHDDHALHAHEPDPAPAEIPARP
ncbi:MAG: hypothetical protein AAF772_13710, partial [Acidobacteriota bacterium]